MTTLSMTEPRAGHDGVTATRVTVQWPGRWIGGAIGGLASLLVAAALYPTARFTDLEPYVSDDLLTAAAFAALLGIPIAFILGRHFAPIAREGGWGSAAMAALAFGLIAPVLGDLEIVGGSLLVPWLTNQSGPEILAGGVAIFLLGLIFCWVALPVTILVGFVWVWLMRLTPSALDARLRMPSPIDRLGARHAFLALGIWLVVAQVGWALFAPIRPW